MGWIRPTNQKKIRNNSLSVLLRNVKRHLLYPEYKHPEEPDSSVATNGYYVNCGRDSLFKEHLSGNT